MCLAFHIQVFEKIGTTIKPERGVRQRDPLSPHFFIIVSEVLPQMLSAHSKNGDITGIKITDDRLIVTHECLMMIQSCSFMLIEKIIAS